MTDLPLSELLAALLSFRVADMLNTGGRPILDALVMLLGSERWFSVSAEQSLPVNRPGNPGGRFS